MDEQPAQINVAAFADAEPLGLAASRVLSWDQAEPGGELASFAESGAVADRRHRCGRHQRPHSRYLAQPPASCILAGDRVDLVADAFDIGVQTLPLLPEMIEQAAQARREVLIGIFQDRGHLLAQLRRPFGEGNAALQQKTADLVDDRGAAVHKPVANSCLLYTS